MIPQLEARSGTQGKCYDLLTKDLDNLDDKCARKA